MGSGRGIEQYEINREGGWSGREETPDGRGGQIITEERHGSDGNWEAQMHRRDRRGRQEQWLGLKGGPGRSRPSSGGGGDSPAPERVGTPQKKDAPKDKSEKKSGTDEHASKPDAPDEKDGSGGGSAGQKDGKDGGDDRKLTGESGGELGPIPAKRRETQQCGQSRRDGRTKPGAGDAGECPEGVAAEIRADADERAAQRRAVDTPALDVRPSERILDQISQPGVEGGTFTVDSGKPRVDPKDPALRSWE